MPYSLIQKIQDGYESFSKGQKLIANYILNHYDKAAFMTASRLGEVVGVSESTVVRFAVELGFDGYPKLQKILGEMIKNKLTSVQRIEVSSNRIREENVLKSVLQSDMNKIKTTLEEFDQALFDKVVEMVLTAKRIYILGVRSAAPLAGFLGFYFNLIFENVKIVNTTSVSEMFEQIINVTKGDVVIGISFPRYSKRTVRSLEFAKNQGAATVAITDRVDSPLSKEADCSLIAGSDMISFVDSLVAPLSVINALIVAVAMKRKENMYKTFEKLEKIWDENHVYE